MNSTVEEVKPVGPVLEWSELSLQHSSVSDSELLEIYRCSRSQAALTEIIRRHSPLVLSVIRRLISNRQDAEDAFQATFLVLVLSLKKIRNPESLGAWLYGVAFRTSKRLRSLRRKANLKEALESHVGVDLDATQSSDEDPLSLICLGFQKAYVKR
jgi:DNA-directed RNA polymerase specialized sigma24 family protein